MNLIRKETNKKGKTNVVVDILMKRDKMSREEAENELAYCQHMIQEAFENNEDPELVIENILGLESDYIFDILC